jgi:arylsulfatase A-like enzyme
MIPLIILSIIPLGFRIAFKQPKKDLIFGFGEDLFIASVEISLLFISKTVFLPLISILQIYYLAEAFLMKKMNIRLNPTHFRFLKTPKLFLDSALAMGFIKWIPFFILLPIITYVSLLISLKKTFLLEIIPFILLLLCYKFTSPISHNSLLLLIISLIHKLFSKNKTSPTQIPNEIIPKCEIFTKVDAKKYPLLKITEGFVGEKQFEYIRESDHSKPNIIFIFLESFRAKNVGCLDAEKGVTPHFDALAKKGILFSQFYANGTSTESALWSTFFGTPQVFHKPGDISETNYANPNFDKLDLISIADILKKEGYSNMLLDGSSLSLDNRGLFLKNHGFEEIVGKEDLPPLLTHNSSSSWGIDDEHLFHFALEKIKNHTKSPLFTSIFTISNHHPWKVPANYHLDTFSEISSPTYRNFLQTMHYTDKCLHDFVHDPIVKDSLFFIFGDHGMSMQERPNKPLGKRNLYEEGVQVPLLIYSNKIKKRKKISDLASQVDILPTVIDLLNIKSLNHSIGTSLMRKANKRTVFFHEPPFLGNGFGIRKENYKLILENQDSYLFNLSKDKKELTPLANKQKKDSLKKSIQEVFSYLAHLFETNSFTYSPYKKAQSMISFNGTDSFITDEEIKKLTENSPYLEALNLSNCHLISDAGLKIISENLTHLKSINCSYNREITGKILSRKRRNWITADFMGCTHLSDQGLDNITTLAPSLKNLSISCNSLTNKGLSKSLLQLPSLTSLTISDCKQLTDSSLKRFNSLSINKLHINQALNFTDKLLFSLTNQPLYSLEISGALKITDKGIQSIAHLPLNKLVILNANLSDSSINTFNHLPLRALVLSSCYHLSKKSFEKLILLNIDLLILKECNPKIKPYLTQLAASRKTTKELYIMF